MEITPNVSGIPVGGCNVSNLGYAEGNVFMAESEMQLQEMLAAISIESKNKGIGLNSGKTDVMATTK